MQHLTCSAGSMYPGLLPKQPSFSYPSKGSLDSLQQPAQSYLLLCSTAIPQKDLGSHEHPGWEEAALPFCPAEDPRTRTLICPPALGKPEEWAKQPACPSVVVTACRSLPQLMHLTALAVNVPPGPEALGTPRPVPQLDFVPSLAPPATFWEYNPSGDFCPSPQGTSPSQKTTAV